MTETKYFIVEAEVDKINLITWNQEIEQERKSAVFDLLNNGKFKLYNKNETGPYKINIKLLEWKLLLRVIDFFDDSITDLKISISSTRRIIRDYQIVCDNYVEAIKTAPLKKIEAIDIGRRTIHDEGAGILLEAFKEKVELDMDTARRLFTLVSIISIKI
ncbi:MAG: UPF0262 protein [Alphaproteobacteria bacterium]|nr:MAG: UPF0262 protein [Alphaproteobacteria bacterium]